MWTIIYRNKESGKMIWEMGFSKYILKRLAFLTNVYNREVFEVRCVYEEPWIWNSFVGCLLHWHGASDEESIKAEGEVK
jgi:hypothetical protein